LIVAVDASTLTLLVNPDADPPLDPDTGQPLTRASERLGKLIDEVERRRGTVLIPTPALAEVLVKAGDAGPTFLERLNSSARFKVADFDQRAAVEVAAMTRDAIRAGDKSAGVTEPWQKVKYDRQIVAIARVNGASALYADDGGVAAFGNLIGLKVIRTWELPLPETKEDLFTLAGVDLTSGPEDQESGSVLDTPEWLARANQTPDK
jgi:hypothetical protein